MSRLEKGLVSVARIPALIFLLCLLFLLADDHARADGTGSHYDARDDQAGVVTLRFGIGSDRVGGGTVRCGSSQDRRTAVCRGGDGHGDFLRIGDGVGGAAVKICQHCAGSQLHGEGHLIGFGCDIQGDVHRGAVPGPLDDVIAFLVGQAIDSQVWRCEVTESLCDEKNIYITISVTTPGEYILVPTDATPEHSVSVISLAGEQTLGEYAAEQNKKLLLVGAGISDSESLGVTTCSQTFESTSAQEMTILLHAKKTASASIHEVTCVVTGLEENVILTHSMPITLVKAPSDGSIRYIPETPDAIPGLTVGEAIVTETPLGISIRIRETITDEEAFRNIMKVEIDGIEYSEGGSVLEDDGNWYFTIPRGQGTLPDTLTVRFLDWNKQPIGTVTFQEK